MKTALERWANKVDFEHENGCWPWTARLNSTGYGMFRFNGSMALAHRVAYELLCGPIGDGFSIGHLCSNRACVNPDHLQPVALTDRQRFWAKVLFDPTDGCWLWIAGCHYSGYGHFKLDGRTQRAHRVSYKWAKGPIPEDLQLDHLCRVRNCVNPEHLEAVTLMENLLRAPWTLGARMAAKTHCKRGHEFTTENTYIRPRGRECKKCHLLLQSIRRAKRST